MYTAYNYVYKHILQHNTVIKADQLIHLFTHNIGHISLTISFSIIILYYE